MLLAVILLSVLLTISISIIIAGYIIIGIQSDKIKTYENWVIEFNKDIQKTYKQLKDVDNKNMFSRDDDVGFAFSQILSIIENLKDKTQ
jgi:predicted PurR-regulated permease PerM